MTVVPFRQRLSRRGLPGSARPSESRSRPGRGACRPRPRRPRSASGSRRRRFTGLAGSGAGCARAASPRPDTNRGGRSRGPAARRGRHTPSGRGLGAEPKGAAERAGRPPARAAPYRPEGLRAEGLRAAGCGRLVLSDALRAVRKVLGRLPRIGRRGVALSPHQVVRPAADRLAVEELLRQVLPHLARVEGRVGGGGRPARRT